jgi:hypothetical protein
MTALPRTADATDHRRPRDVADRSREEYGGAYSSAPGLFLYLLAIASALI